MCAKKVLSVDHTLPRTDELHRLGYVAPDAGRTVRVLGHHVVAAGVVAHHNVERRRLGLSADEGILAVGIQHQEGGLATTAADVRGRCTGRARHYRLLRLAVQKTAAATDTADGRGGGHEILKERAYAKRRRATGPVEVI